MATRIEPLTAELWPALEDLFGRQGACYGCWCTHFRLPPATRRQNNRESNRAHFMTRVETGPPPGLIAIEDGIAMGWMQIGPRADVPEWNNQGRVSAPLSPDERDDAGVWAVSCFFVRARARGQGLTHLLVTAGIDHARAGGARLIDACPITESKSARPVGLFVGSARVFEKAGFERVAERKAGRPLMRMVL